MKRERSKRVVSIGEKLDADTERLARLITEACHTSEPSKEAKAYVDDDLASNPDEWRRHGDLTREALDLALKDFYLGYYSKAAVIMGAERLKQELGIDDAPASIRILIEHAVLCHARLGMVEHLYSRNASARMDVIEHWERRLTLVQKRFTRAMTTLARTRALLARAETAQAEAERAQARAGLRVLKQA